LAAALGPELFSQLKTICAGDDVEKKKPAPDIYLMAAEQCGLDPRSCLAIEDTSHGLASAKTAGMSCIVTPSAFADDEDFSLADAVFENLGAPQVTVSDLRDIHDSQVRA
jgi:beta-phosphoglucomutase-like phosphatase (HAD superfamily)